MVDTLCSYLLQAVLHELCEAIVNDLTSLSASSLTSLLQSSLHTLHLQQTEFISSVYEEIETRIGNSSMNIEQICELIRVLSIHPNSSQEVTDNAWIHLGNRFRGLRPENMKKVYETMRYITPKFKYLFVLCDKRLRLDWKHLNHDDVVAIFHRMTVCNHYSASTLTHLARWISINIHDITDQQLMIMIAAYDHFHFSDPRLIQSIERYVQSKIRRMDETLIGMVMDFFRSRRYLSPIVFDSVASHFAKQGQEFQTFNMCKVLKTFGQMNYVPKGSSELFGTVEEILSTRFNDFEVADILEMLASFTYIERFPLNFTNRIFSPFLMAKLICKYVATVFIHLISASFSAIVLGKILVMLCLILGIIITILVCKSFSTLLMLYHALHKYSKHLLERNKVCCGIFAYLLLSILILLIMMIV